LLVVAGEASGDRIASEVLRALAPRRIEAFGIGGSGCRREGMETLDDVSEVAAMGALDVARRMPAVARALGRLFSRLSRGSTKAALLVNFTELNARLGRVLRRRGVRVLWAVAPQVWAWRAGRIRALHSAVDRLAVLLPFEEPLWRGAGYDARFVGHPAAEVDLVPRALARDRLGLRGRRAVVVLPGSRAGEVARLAPVFCEAAANLVAQGDVDEARVLAAPWLDAKAREDLDRAALRFGIPVVTADADRGAAPLLGAFDLALCASGTACLESTLAGLPTVIAYRVDPLTYAIARRVVRTPHIGLPNVLLERRVFPELIQDAANPKEIVAAARQIMSDEALVRVANAEIRSSLAPRGQAGKFGERVAALLDPWLVGS